MIEVLTAANGAQVLRQDGRLLASRFDPFKEAAQWLAQRQSFLPSVKNVFVLGLGCGYHVQALLKATAAQILVIETDAEMISQAAKIQKWEASHLHILHIESLRALRADQRVRAAVQASFVVLRHAPSEKAHSEVYKQLQAQLLGRDWGSLTWQWSLRDGPDLDSTTRIDASAQALSIYDLQSTELVQNSEERERLLLKALRELVK